VSSHTRVAALPRELRHPALTALVRDGRARGSLRADEVHAATTAAGLAPERVPALLKALADRGVAVRAEGEAVAAAARRTTALHYTSLFLLLYKTLIFRIYQQTFLKQSPSSV